MFNLRKKERYRYVFVASLCRIIHDKYKAECLQRILFGVVCRCKRWHCILEDIWFASELPSHHTALLYQTMVFFWVDICPGPLLFTYTLIVMVEQCSVYRAALYILLYKTSRSEYG